MLESPLIDELVMKMNTWKAPLFAILVAWPRQFVFLKPDVFVVYDRLALADPDQRPCWMLHPGRK